jgi:hypothetical protein
MPRRPALPDATELTAALRGRQEDTPTRTRHLTLAAIHRRNDVRARYEIRITPDDVGRRVSVRARIPAAPGQPSTTDTLGVLRSWEEGVLRIERRDGSTVEIAHADLLAGRIIPPPPARRRPSG